MPIRTGAEYIESLRGRGLQVYLLGERVAEPVDHPIIRPSINAVAATYDLAASDPDLASALSPLTGTRVNRFLHIAESAGDLVQQNRMQRRLGQLTGTCFQRCVGMDALNALYSVTFDIDADRGTGYHERLRAFITEVQRDNLVIGGAMTDPKGDRSKGPSQQADPDLYVRVCQRRDDGIVIRGAKAHQTGCINSHWLMVMPTMRMADGDDDYAIVCAVPVHQPGLTFIHGRQSCDTRALEGGDLDQGNARYAGQEALIVIDDVFVPWERVFMNGETGYAVTLVERFTAYHRRSYVCKTGLGDVLIGAAATIADYNGVPRASHIRDKLVEMGHLNETIYGAGMASSHEARPTASGNYLCDPLLANVCKHNVTRFPYELARLAQDLAGGLVATLPSERDFDHPVTGPLLTKYLRGRADVATRDRARMLRLIENMTMGRNAVGYLTESLHGAGSPQAQRIQIFRQMDLEGKKRLAARLAGIGEASPEATQEATQAPTVVPDFLAPSERSWLSSDLVPLLGAGDWRGGVAADEPETVALAEFASSLPDDASPDVRERVSGLIERSRIHIARILHIGESPGADAQPGVHLMRAHRAMRLAAQGATQGATQGLEATRLLLALIRVPDDRPGSRVQVDVDGARVHLSAGAAVIVDKPRDGIAIELESAPDSGPYLLWSVTYGMHSTNRESM